MNDEPKDLLLIGDSMISKLKIGIARDFGGGKSTL